MDNNDAITSRLIFNEDAAFYLLKRVNRHNLRICASENPRDSFEHERDTPKLNNFVAVLELEVHGQFFCTESRVTRILYLDLVQGWLMPQLQKHTDLVIQRSSHTTLNDKGRSNIHELFRINVLGGWGGERRMKRARKSSLLSPIDLFLFKG